MAATRFGTSLILVLGLLAILGPPAAAQDARTTLNVALFGEPDFLDPHVATSIGFVPIDNAYESLVYTEQDTTHLIPSLAESRSRSAPTATRWGSTTRSGCSSCATSGAWRAGTWASPSSPATAWRRTYARRSRPR